MKYWFIFTFVTTLTCTFSALQAQSTVDVYSKYAVQRMSDGKTFRILEVSEDQDQLTENTRFTFDALSPADSVLYVYSLDEDQLYVLGWKPARTNKKYEAKLAVLWRTSTTHTRFGTVSVPAGFLFEGFLKDVAYFVNSTTLERYELYFSSHYNTGIATVDYTLKGRKSNGASGYVNNYYAHTSPWDYAESKIPNPDGPTLRRAREARETFLRDSALSPALAMLKAEYQRQTPDPEWGVPKLMLEAINDSIIWTSGNYNGRTNQEIRLFISEQYYPSDKLSLNFFSEHPEIIPEQTVNLAQYTIRNGIREFRLSLRHLPGIQCRIKFAVAAPTPVFLAEYIAGPFAQVKAEHTSEEYYPKNKNVLSIAAAQFPEVRYYTLWADYALEHHINLNGHDLYYGLRSVYEKEGFNFDNEEFLESRPQRYRTGSVKASINNMTVVVLSLSPPALKVRPTEGSYNWIQVPFDEMPRLPNQEYHVYLTHFSFPKDILDYDFEYAIVPESPPVYIMFLSKPEQKK